MERKVRHFFGISVACLLISACAPVTESTLRTDNEKQRSFNIDQPYQTTFQSILDKSRACFLDVPGDAQFTVVGTRVNRSRTGEIVVAEVYGKTSRQVMLLVDVIAINDNETQINTYHDSRYAEPYVANMRNWLIDPASTCVPVEDDEKVRSS
jgi:hypothetical protein